jgi:NADH-quinone oxidoreductase subunit L
MTWLPDAMAGPTPVSALIHAATMVTAGVYLLCRLFPLVSLSPDAMVVIAAVGVLTAFYASTCALAQREIKKVLAFSTMSQVGFMMLAVGVGTVSGAMFHLFTHAFFKALLFMGAGCVIHLAGGENDIYKMGGMKDRSKLVFWTFLIAALCLAGAPLTGGFFSKDEILLADFARGTLAYRAIWAVGTLTAFLTALYTFRLVYLVFAGKPRVDHNAHTLPKLMRWTLPPLAFLALFGGLLNLPPAYGGKARLADFLGPLAGYQLHATHAVEYALAALATILFLAGWLLARWRFRRISGEPEEQGARLFLLRGWAADALVRTLIVRPFDVLARFFWKVVDGMVIEGILNGVCALSQGGGEALRRVTTGRLATYLGAFAWGLVLILSWFLISLAW